MIQIYHNPRCGKSRTCLTFLENSNQDYEVILYLNENPSFDDLKNLLGKLNIKPIELVRIKEKIWIDNYKNQTLNYTQITQAMADNPILIERPVVVKDGKAIIGRDMEKVQKFL